MEFNATFIVSAISFVVFSILMNAIFYKPLSDIVLRRQKFIEESNEDAKSKHKQAEEIIRDKTRKLEKTKQEARKILSAKTDEVHEQKAQMAHQAQKKAVDEIASAKQDLNQEVESVEALLEGRATELADIISSKILGQV